MHAVKQINPYTCALACIESLANDKKQPITQSELVDKFPDVCRKGHREEGTLNYEGLVNILESLQLVGNGLLAPATQDNLNDVSNRVPNGVFIFSQRGEDGISVLGHCWRVKTISLDGVDAMEPDTAVSTPFDFLNWERLNRRGSIVLSFEPFPQT